MSLQRPVPGQMVELSEEMILETTVLDQLRQLNSGVDRIQRGQDNLRTVLLGDTVGETKHGRLPMVEETVADHETRITSLETDRTRSKGFLAGVAAVSSVFGAVAMHVIDGWARGYFAK